MVTTVILFPAQTWDSFRYHELHWEIDVLQAGYIVATVPLTEMKNELEIEKQHAPNFNGDNMLFVLLLKRHIERKEEVALPNGLLEVIDYLLENQVTINSQYIEFVNPIMPTLQTKYNLPDCIWISAVYGRGDCLKKFLPHWNQHPLTILLFLRPWIEISSSEKMLKSIKNILPVLFDLGGPLSQGSELCSHLKEYCSQLINEDRRDDAPVEHLYNVIYCELTEILNTRPNLVQLCKLVIRENVKVNDCLLPSALSSMVPLPLKHFLSLKEPKRTEQASE